MRKRALRLICAVGGATALAVVVPNVAFAQEEVDATTTLGFQHQPAVGGHRRRPGDLHAGRLRARRDRLHPEEERRSRDEHELRHLRPRLRRLPVRRLPARVRWLQLRRPTSVLAASPMNDAIPLIGSRQLGLPLAGLGPPRQRRRRRRCSASSSTWWPSWTPWPRSPPGRWPSAGSGSSFVIWGLFCGAIYYPIFAAWTWGGGWLGQDLGHHEPRRRLRRLRRLRRRARRRWCRGARRCDRARSPHRQVRPRRQAQGDPAATTSRWRSARLLHPAVRLVRLQRRLDVRRHRRAVRHGRHQHGDRRRGRRRRRACSTSPSGPASPTPA